jgi:hypothetical protein
MTTAALSTLRRPLSEAMASELTLPMEDELEIPNAISTSVNNGNAIRLREERRLQRQVLQWMGRPYWVRSNAWCFPVAILLGVLLGLGSFLLGASSNYFRHHPPLSNSWSILVPILILRLCLGGSLSGLCLYGLASSPRTIRHFYHDLVDLQVDPVSAYSIREGLLVVFATWILIAVGAPLGPEMMVTSLGSLLVTLFRVCFSTRRYRRTVACWMQAAVAGSLACVMPSFMGSLVAVFELVASARPHDMTLDAVLQRQANAHHQTDNNQRVVEGNTNDNNSEDQPLQIPLISNHGTIYRPNRHLSSLEQDFMELLLLSAVTALCASTVQQKLNEAANITSPWKDFQHVLPALHGETTAGHCFLAVPLGVLGGIFGTLALWLAAVARRIRVQICIDDNSPSRKAHVMLSCFAGCLVALLCWPQLTWVTNGVVDDGRLVSWELLKHPSSWSVIELLVIGFCQLLNLVVALGLGGWIGGAIFPLTSFGVCLGLVESKIFQSLPLSLVASCSIASVVGSMVPVPFGIAITLVQLFDLDAQQGGPVLIAALVGHSVTGGLGLTRRCARRMIGIRSGYSSEEEEEEELAEQFRMNPTDDEILRDIRMAIFGGNPTV